MADKKFHRRQLFSKRAHFLSALTPYIDLPLVGDVLNDVTDALMAVMPDTVPKSVVFESVRVFAGSRWLRKDVARFAWRLAGNLDTLIEGRPVMPWTRQLYDEIVPVCVERVSPSRRRDAFGFVFHCRVLAGSPCAELITQFFTVNSCRAISRLVGFSTAPWGPLQYAGIGVHFVNMLFFAHVEAERSRERLSFRRVSVSSSMLKVNKELLAVRCRTKPCPIEYEHACANCQIGYDECAFAVHAKTFVEAHCRVCNSQSFFNPEDDGLMCINCAKSNHHVSS